MNEKSEGAGSVVVLEEGADWPSWVSEYQRLATNSVVVAYAPGESAAEFTARVERRLSEVTEELRVAIVACAARTDPERLAMRERICHLLLDRMAPWGRGEVLLAANVGGSESCKHAIFELAGDLCDGLRGSSRVVRVRFSSGRPESGIISSVGAPSVPVAEADHPAYRFNSAPRR